MSISNIDLILTRIEIATKESPIAVFKVPPNHMGNTLDAVFGATIDAKDQISQDKAFIGLFYGSMGTERARQLLEAAKEIE